MPPSAPAPAPANRDERGTSASVDPSEALSQCLLSQYKYCVGGLAAGVAYSVPSKRGIVPVMAAGVAGSLADVMWGLMVECQSEVSAYKESRGMK
mmetsp:Transcript_2871/g.8399  ORF Transcript_2871/g.8399 Transcript_2871/m.8399 type:complete len:95 (-) Transcript_2871:898-1182(-)